MGSVNCFLKRSPICFSMCRYGLSPPLPNKRNATRSLKERELDLCEHVSFLRSQQSWRLRIDEHDDFIDGILRLRDVGNGASTRDRRGWLVYDN